MGRLAGDVEPSPGAGGQRGEQIQFGVVTDRDGRNRDPVVAGLLDQGPELPVAGLPVGDQDDVADLGRLAGQLASREIQGAKDVSGPVRPDGGDLGGERGSIRIGSEPGQGDDQHGIGAERDHRDLVSFLQQLQGGDRGLAGQGQLAVGDGLRERHRGRTVDQQQQSDFGLLLLAPGVRVDRQQAVERRVGVTAGGERIRAADYRQPGPVFGDGRIQGRYLNRGQIGRGHVVEQHSAELRQLLRIVRHLRGVKQHQFVPEPRDRLGQRTGIAHVQQGARRAHVQHRGQNVVCVGASRIQVFGHQFGRTRHRRRAQAGIEHRYPFLEQNRIVDQQILVTPDPDSSPALSGGPYLDLDREWLGDLDLRAVQDRQQGGVGLAGFFDRQDVHRAACRRRVGQRRFQITVGGGSVAGQVQVAAAADAGRDRGGKVAAGSAEFECPGHRSMAEQFARRIAGPQLGCQLDALRTIDGHHRPVPVAQIAYALIEGQEQGQHRQDAQAGRSPMSDWPDQGPRPQRESDDRRNRQYCQPGRRQRCPLPADRK